MVSPITGEAGKVKIKFAVKTYTVPETAVVDAEITLTAYLESFISKTTFPVRPLTCVTSFASSVCKFTISE